MSAAAALTIKPVSYAARFCQSPSCSLKSSDFRSACVVEAESTSYSSPPPRRLSSRHDARSGIPAFARSEEHTSELQSLMRISYAVFCLKKTKKAFTIPKTIEQNKHNSTT